ncbi:hypothetical protein L226DRAFT_521907 [Lentinus tigrinus ALCF2SS1-7]|uniref:uncharacterized protein n=1 Tax=Lentinus tigrinus ALCF2SS1-7 TaxID=1328758 RepID=UPI001165D352|nr:hypothetical protein L226DRAFT_521907 [Lentinus tigrinus ALCF2SS1-7]
MPILSSSANLSTTSTSRTSSSSPTHRTTARCRTRIAKALVERIVRAGHEGTKFRMVVVIPEVPGFAGQVKGETSVKTIMAGQYRTSLFHTKFAFACAILPTSMTSFARSLQGFRIVQVDVLSTPTDAVSPTAASDGEIIYEEVRKAGYEPSDYIRFYHFRAYDRINAPWGSYMKQIQERSGVSSHQLNVALGHIWVGRGEGIEDPKEVSVAIPTDKSLAEQTTSGKKSELKTETYTMPGTLEEAREIVDHWREAAQELRSDEAISDNVVQHKLHDLTSLVEKRGAGTEDQKRAAFVSELLYIHSKVMIVDDRRFSMGSANLNDRSQKGDGHSEIALVVEDEDMMDSMNTENSHPENVTENPANNVQSQGSPGNVATTSATVIASGEPQKHNDPPCDCWRNRVPEDKRYSHRPIALRLVLPPVRAEVKSAIEAFNSIIELIQKRAIEFGDATRILPPDIRGPFVSYRDTVANSFEIAIETLTSAPGFVCKQGSVEHERLYLEQRKLFTDMGEACLNWIKESERLFQAQEAIVLAYRHHRRKVYLQAVVRAMSIISIPYSPLLSAIFTAAEVFGISVHIAMRERVSEESSVRDALEQITNLEETKREASETLAQLRHLKEHLETVRSMLDEMQQQPLAAQLAAIYEKLYFAKKAVVGALSAHRDNSDAVVPFRDIVLSFQDMVEALEAPAMFDGRLASLSEDQCAAIDRALAILRSSEPATAPTPAGLD